MAFDSAFQPFLLDVGNLALGCSRVDVDSAPVGWFSSAEFTLEGETRETKAGYPLRTTGVELDSVSASAQVSFQEVGGAAKTLLTSIINSLNTGVVPKHDVLLEVFRPRSENVVISMANAGLLQEFDLNFGLDFNEVNLTFEQLVPAGSTLSSLVGFSTLGQVTFGSTTPLLDEGDVSIGLPRIEVQGSSLGSIQAASLKLQTNYRRVETGYPKTLMELTPLEHTVILEVDVEEFTEASLDEGFVLGSIAPVTFKAALYDGTAVVITLPEAISVPAGGPSTPDSEFAIIKKKFMATGNTLLSIA